MLQAPSLLGNPSDATRETPFLRHAAMCVFGRLNAFASLPQFFAGLTDANAYALRTALAQSSGPVLVHCASGNRAGALLALVQARDGAPVDQALQLGRDAGMTSLEAPTRALLEQAAAR